MYDIESAYPQDSNPTMKHLLGGGECEAHLFVRYDRMSDLFDLIYAYVFSFIFVFSYSFFGPYLTGVSQLKTFPAAQMKKCRNGAVSYLLKRLGTQNIQLWINTKINTNSRTEYENDGRCLKPVFH